MWSNNIWFLWKWCDGEIFLHSFVTVAEFLIYFLFQTLCIKAFRMLLTLSSSLFMLTRKQLRIKRNAVIARPMEAHDNGDNRKQNCLFFSRNHVVVVVVCEIVVNCRCLFYFLLWLWITQHSGSWMTLGEREKIYCFVFNRNDSLFSRLRLSCINILCMVFLLQKIYILFVMFLCRSWNMENWFTWMACGYYHVKYSPKNCDFHP